MKINVCDVPNDTTVWNYILKNSNTQEAWEDVSQSYYMPDIFRMKHNWDCDELSKDIEEAKELYGDYSWSYVGETKRSPYTGFALSYNPNHIDNLSEHEGSLGRSPDLIPTEGRCKNSFFDSHGINKRTTASKYKSIGKLLDCSKRTLMRSRVATCHGNTDTMLENRKYHTDTFMHHAIRLNIPITTSNTYFFKMENRDEPIFLEKGWAYTLDNKIPHKVFTARLTSKTRTHLVLGYSPWWDYNIEEDAWSTNEFFGKKHPMQMVMDGDVLSGLSDLDVDI